MLTNLPNLLTLFRIGVVPVLVALFYLDSFFGRWLACGLFGIAAITDFFDGYFARVWRQQSILGQFLDPVADKLLVSAALLMMVEENLQRRNLIAIEKASALQLLLRNVDQGGA